MKFKTVKTIGLAVIAIAGLIITLTAEAAPRSGMLGTSAAAADSYTFSCPTGTLRSRIRVMDLTTIANRTATVFATFGEDGRPPVPPAVSDTESTSTGSANAINTLNGSGLYTLVVNKSAAGKEDYAVVAECQNSSGTYISVTLTLKTNQ
ncbi:MAG: hypothetical protein HOO93_18880 [Methyloglobulus sp.]|nr:hypothetical protein [Methyloglobulus sp.]